MIASRAPPLQGAQSALRRAIASRRPVAAAQGGERPCSVAPGQAVDELIRVTIKKPLGLVMAERRSTDGQGPQVFVEEIFPEGNAARTGLVRVGDVLSKTSATVLKRSSQDSYGKNGHGDYLYDSWETVEFDCEGQDFATVMSAIGSNNERWGIKTVTMTLRRAASG